MTKFSENKHLVKKQPGRPRILIAPLDWGLGHATRCIPVIYEFLAQGAEVWLAGEAAQERLLRQEFPSIPFLSLPGYRVKYARSGPGLTLALLWQLPRLWRRISLERKWLETTVKEYEFDAIVSDNRFGLTHPAVPCIFITHQLRIKTPLGKWMEDRLQQMNYRFIRQFAECWVPDKKEAGNLAGELSHPARMPGVPVFYCGILSRLKPAGRPVQKNHLFISLSGPEPQRTIWENAVINEIAHYGGTATIVRGLPNEEKLIPSTNDIRFFNHLPADLYNEEMEKAEWVISRSGYSTVMDIATLGKKSILVPTPGQPEQEYLAAYLSQNKFAPAISQRKFSLAKALQAASQFAYRPFEKKERSGLGRLIAGLLKKI